MKNKKTLLGLIILIGALALFAAAMGLFYQTPGSAYSYTNHRGETVQINGHGLYYYDTVSSAAQMTGNDIITLCVGLPLLVVSTWWAFRGSLRGRLLLTGTLGFFLYTYMSMSMLTSFNALFLVYVALFSLSLFAFVLCLAAFDVTNLTDRFSPAFPRRLIAGLLFFVAVFLFMAWAGRIVSPLLKNATPVLDNTTTLVIQTMDLGLIVPLAFVGGILLLRRNAWGYLLASVLVMKAITMGLAVSTMAVVMASAGVPEQLGIVVPFFTITLLNLGAAVLLMHNVREPQASAPRRESASSLKLSARGS